MLSMHDVEEKKYQCTSCVHQHIVFEDTSVKNASTETGATLFNTLSFVGGS